MEKEKPKNRLEEIMKYFRGRLRGNHCEGCGRVFDDGDIIFTPDQTSKEHLMKYGYTVVQNETKEEPTEMTLEEIEKLVGKKVKIIKK